MSIDYSDEGRSADRGEVLLSTSVISEDEKEYWRKKLFSNLDNMQRQFESNNNRGGNA